MDRQGFIDAELTNYLKEFPNATDAELDDITSSSARTFDLQQKPQEYSAIPTMDTTKGFAENVAKDAPVLLGKVAEGGGDFAATAMQGTKKAVETLLSPLDTEAEAEAKRQATDVAYGSIKNALGEGVRNIQKYYQGEAPEFEPTAGVEPKSELYPADYNERLTKAKEKRGQPKPEAPGIFEQIPGGREVRESIKAIPQFIGQSAADVGSLAGNLYEGDPETVQQFYEKPLTTAGMPALGVAIPLSLGYRKTIGKKTEGKPAPAELTPEEAQYKAKFDAELQKAQLENAVETKVPIAERPMNTEQNFEEALAADIYKKQPMLDPKIQAEIEGAGVEPLADMRGTQKITPAVKASVLEPYEGPLEDTRGLQVPKTDGIIESPEYLRELESRRLMESDLAKEAELRSNQQTALQKMFAKTTKEAKANKKTNAQFEASLKKQNVKEGLIAPEQQQGGWLAQLMDEAKQNGLQTKQEVQDLAISKGRKISRETAQSILTDIKTETELGLETQQKPINKLFQKGKEFLGNEEGSLNIGPITNAVKGGFKEVRTKLFSAREKLAEFTKPLDYIFQFAFEKYAPTIKGVKKTARVAALEDVDQYRYADNLMKRFLKDSGLGESIAEDLTKAGLDIDDLGAYAQSRRILFERDPRGLEGHLTKAQAIAQMNEFNPKQRAAVQKVFEDIQREWQTTIVPEIVGSEIFPNETNEYIKKNNNYSRDVGVDKAKEFIAKGSGEGNENILAHLEGSRQATLNPIEQMVIYARTLNQFKSREVMKRNLVEKLADNGLVSDEPKLGYAPVEYAHKGEWVKKFVPEDMAQPLMKTPAESWTSTKFVDWLVYNNPVSKWITTQIITNPSFVASNSMVVDPLTTWAQLPSFKSIYGYPIAHTLTILEAAGSTHAAKLAKAWGLKPLNEARADMTKRNLYNIGSLYDKATSGETQLGEMMDTLGLNQKALEFFKGKTNVVSKAYGAFKTQASKLDNTSKESLFRYLEAKEGWRGEAKINQMVREMGTPATKRGGTGEPIARRTTLFGNAILQATRATAKNFADSPVQFTLKNVGVPMALAYGTYKWIQSDPETKKAWNTLSDYQKRNFVNIYTGKGTDGQPAFFTLPLPRFAKVAYGLMLDSLESDKSFGEKATNVGLGLLGGAFNELPNAAAQPLALAYDVRKYMSGKSPYDNFRKQDVIPVEIMKADSTLYNKLMGDDKMNDLSTTKAFASYLLNTYGVGGWFKTDALKSVPEGYGWTKLPAINRFIRFGGSGVKSNLMEAKDEGAKLNARAALIIKDAVQRSLDNKKPLEDSAELSEAMTYLPNKITNELMKGVLKQESKATGDEAIDLYTTLKGTTPMQKMLIIQKFQKMFPNEK